MIHFLLALTAVQYMQGCGILLIATWVIFIFNFGLNCLLHGKTKSSVVSAIEGTVLIYGILLIFFVPIGLIVDFFLFLGVFS